jgi:hypothetical protein
MILSLPANPVPAELYQFMAGASPPIWLPWYIWGGGVYATKYNFNPSQFHGYLGSVSVPLAGSCPVIVKSLRVTGHNNPPSLLYINLIQRTGNVSGPVASVAVPGSGPFNITQLVAGSGFAATPSVHSLAIEILGVGQGIATITGLFVELQY